MMWQTQTTIEYPFALRPASIEEAGLFYSQMDEAEDAVLGTVGHIRMDFGASGKEFYHTWWPHNGDQFNTGEFKDELQKFVDMLRADGPLTNLASMRNYCYQHGGIVSVVAPDYKQQGQTVIPPELQYVEVISVTASTGYDANTGEAQTDDEDGKELPSTVTLLVTPEQSKVLAELEEEGTIHLTLVYRGSKENAEKFLTAQDDVLLELYPPEPDPEEASQEETTQEETPTGTDNPEETEVETPTESEEVV